MPLLYNTAMNFSRILAVATVALAAGCATWRFTPVMTAVFVNENNEYATIDSGREEREQIVRGVDGRDVVFVMHLKVRVEMPDGERFVAYQVPADVPGALYRTDDGEWQVLEQGVSCMVFKMDDDGEGYVKRFEGVICSQKNADDDKPQVRRGRNEGTRVLNSPYERLDDTKAKRAKRK